MAKTKTQKTPSWWDPKKLVSVIFAFEDGRAAYGGHAIDLGDGTCRIADHILLGENSLKWGDRVDLFYNPTDPLSRPHIGYRVYDRADDPPSKLPGKNYGARREPTPEQRERHEQEEARRAKREDMQHKQLMDGLMAGVDLLTALGMYAELLALALKAGVDVPKKLLKLPDTWKKSQRRRHAKEQRERKKLAAAAAKATKKKGKKS
jgi:hypothetical protein